MWFFLNNAFVSAVQHPVEPDIIVVRGRAMGDVSRFIGHAVEETYTPKSDYHYRVEMDRKDFLNILMTLPDRIDYTNFKASVRADDRHDAYAGCWHEMYHFQSVRRGMYEAHAPGIADRDRPPARLHPEVQAAFAPKSFPRATLTPDVLRAHRRARRKKKA